MVSGHGFCRYKQDGVQAILLRWCKLFSNYISCLALENHSFCIEIIYCSNDLKIYNDHITCMSQFSATEFFTFTVEKYLLVQKLSFFPIILLAECNFNLKIGSLV